ncbi:MAG: EAL domain-containing protein [Christensenellaceae bacterium]
MGSVIMSSPRNHSQMYNADITIDSSTLKSLKSTKSTFLISIIIVAIILVFIIMFSNIYIKTVSVILSEETETKLSEVSHQSATSIKSKITGDLQTLDAIATFISHQSSLNIEQSLPVLKAESDKNSFKRMGIILPSGIAYTTDGEVIDFSTRPYFISAMNGNATLSDTFTDIFDGENVNVYAVPIYHDNTVSGVLFATHNTTVFTDFLEVSTFDGAGYSHIIKKDGTPVILSNHPASASTFDNYFSYLQRFKDDTDIINEMQTDMKNNQSGVIKYSYPGGPRFVAYQPLGISDWELISVVPASVVTQKTDFLLHTTLIVSIVISIIFSVLLFYITILHNKHKKVLARLAFEDALTGIGNWNSFVFHSSKLLDKGTSYAWLLFDIDNFKMINEIYGYDEGNKILKNIAKSVSSSLSKDELVGRISSDNFAVLAHYENKEMLEERICSIFDQMMTSQTFSAAKPYELVFSCGIYIIDDPTLPLNLINDRANIARLTIKNNHAASFAFYDHAMNKQLLEEKAITDRMQFALDNHEFIVYLQPKFDLKTTKVVGAEALVRWNHPEKGLISPMSFIPLFEKNGFVTKIDFYVFEEVCKLLREWINAGIRPVRISINLSRIHLFDPALCQALSSIAAKYDINPSLLEIELTESAISEDETLLLDTLHKLRLAGFTLSMDDFGTGYSSLNLLKELPVDIIKLDGQFFKNCEKRGMIVVEDIVRMAKRLDIVVVAEGVETQDQITFLRRINCDIVQGYFYARPMCIEDFEKLFTEQSS